jgi:uncharacterized membrane protein (UPF0136 family)
MSYAGLGQVTSVITSGSLAKADPFMSKASLMASNVMKKMVPIPQQDRAAWLRRSLNGLWPRMGDETMISVAKITASGKARDQAIFDAIRLALANRLMEWAGQEAAKRGGMSGLGDFASDARTFACTGASLSATTGGWVGAFRPGADTSIVTGAAAGAGIANCNLESLRLQAEIAAQQANAAATAANAGADRTSRNIVYAGIGVATLVGLAITAKVLLK